MTDTEFHIAPRGGTKSDSYASPGSNITERKADLLGNLSKILNQSRWARKEYPPVKPPEDYRRYRENLKIANEVLEARKAAGDDDFGWKIQALIDLMRNPNELEATIPLLQRMRVPQTTPDHDTRPDGMTPISPDEIILGPRI